MSSDFEYYCIKCYASHTADMLYEDEDLIFQCRKCGIKRTGNQWRENMIGFNTREFVWKEHEKQKKKIVRKIYSENNLKDDGWEIHKERKYYTGDYWIMTLTKVRITYPYRGNLDFNNDFDTILFNKKLKKPPMAKRRKLFTELEKVGNTYYFKETG